MLQGERTKHTMISKSYHEHHIANPKSELLGGSVSTVCLEYPAMIAV